MGARLEDEVETVRESAVVVLVGRSDLAQPTPATFIFHPIKQTMQKIPQPQVKLEQSSQPLLKPRVNADLSSDATIPASAADLAQCPEEVLQAARAD